MKNTVITEYRTSIEDYLWFTGSNSHLLTKQERMEFIYSLKDSSLSLTPKQRIVGLSYLLHAYFASMDIEERKEYLDTFLSIIEKDNDCIGDYIEMLGIISKKADRIHLSRIIEYIKGGYMLFLETASSIVALCNCISYIYDEVSVEEKSILINILNKMLEINKYSFVDESIELTKEIITESNI